MTQESTLLRRTFVLVHGYWDGGWAWSQMAPLLRMAGHDVYTPTLTGSGERVHLRHPDVTLDTHVQDIVNMLRYEDLRRVILVGWSYGGMVITGVAEHVPERLAHLVYLDAFVPQDGQSAADLIGPEAMVAMEETARARPGRWVAGARHISTRRPPPTDRRAAQAGATAPGRHECAGAYAASHLHLLQREAGPPARRRPRGGCQAGTGGCALAVPGTAYRSCGSVDNA